MFFALPFSQFTHFACPRPPRRRAYRSSLPLHQCGISAAPYHPCPCLGLWQNIRLPDLATFTPGRIFPAHRLHFSAKNNYDIIPLFGASPRYGQYQRLRNLSSVSLLGGGKFETTLAHQGCVDTYKAGAFSVESLFDERPDPCACQIWPTLRLGLPENRSPSIKSEISPFCHHVKYLGYIPL